MSDLFTHLDWDTKYFGFSVASINSLDLDEQKLHETLKLLRDSDYRMVYLKTPLDDHRLFHLAKANGGYLADVKVTYTNTLQCAAESIGITSNIISYIKAKPTVEMEELAVLSSKYSRFRVDPIFPDELCDKMYLAWINRSTSKKVAWEILVFKGDDDITGLVTLADNNGQGKIGLLAVAEHMQGVGIGRSLLEAAHMKFITRGYTISRVVTQKNNIPACSLYESCGYIIEKEENIFHFWL